MPAETFRSPNAVSRAPVANVTSLSGVTSMVASPTVAVASPIVSTATCSVNEPCPRAEMSIAPALRNTSPAPTSTRAMSVVATMLAFTPAPAPSPTLVNATVSLTANTLSATSLNTWSSLGIPVTVSAAFGAMSTSVSTLSTVRSVAPAPLTRPPVSPLMFCVYGPLSTGLSVSAVASTSSPVASRVTPLPMSAVVSEVTVWPMSAPAPARKPPAKVVICALNRAV